MNVRLRRAAAALLAATIIALGYAPARAEDLTVDELLAKARAGLPKTTPASEVEDWTAHSEGLDGSWHVVRRRADVKVTLVLGPFVAASGVVAGQRWHQTDNGTTVLDKPQPSQIEKLVDRTLDRVSQPIDAYRVTTNYASGHITRTYYDPKTYLVERIERVAAGRTTFTDYDDFRTDASGRTRAWHYSGGSDRTEDAYDYRLRGDAVDEPIDDADIALPPDRRMLIEFPAGRQIVRLPARIERNRIYIRVKIGERGLDLLLDSGAYGLGLNERIIKELGLKVQGRNSSAGGAYSSGRVVVPQINVGPLAMHDVVMATVPFDNTESADTKVVGVLGFDFIAHAVLHIDYEHGTVDAILPSSFRLPAGAFELPATLNTQQPHVELSLGASTSSDFLIDTGSPGSLLLFRRFLTMHDADPALVSAFRPEDAAVATIQTLEGPTPVRRVALRDVRLGPYRFDLSNGLVALDRNAFGSDTEDGIVGANILRMFDVYLDYQGGRVILEPNSSFPLSRNDRISSS